MLRELTKKEIEIVSGGKDNIGNGVTQNCVGAAVKSGLGAAAGTAVANGVRGGVAGIAGGPAGIAAGVLTGAAEGAVYGAVSGSIGGYIGCQNSSGHGDNNTHGASSNCDSSMGGECHK
ncbi:hypothetical protein [Rosenbergiella nectarea]|uniref:hypothetical protein n=1 Tax=Rosenbergiella nectarea TaxID=988801 RepID=UPI001BDAFECC|nr:hypothetical protein [Rosenbergiella nectarea]MBT0731661.1 hypothetical protein [Rosenbergiella nectarea subsp. apis]